MITAGVDIGTRFIKVCVADDGNMVGFSCRETDRRFNRVLKDAFTSALEESGVKKRDVKKIVATGYGAHLVKKADYTLRADACIARGAYRLDSSVKTVIDAGGLFINLVTISKKGYLEFGCENEKCAAGSGKFLEMIAEAVEIPFEMISDCSFSSTEPFQISSSCAVFAESDVISQLNAGRHRSDIIAGVLQSIASKAVTLYNSVDAKPPVAITGGLAKIPAFIGALSAALECDVVQLPIDPQLLAAYGAAVMAQGKN